MRDVMDFASQNPELFAAQVRAARGLLNWSQAYLAEGIGVARSTIADLESNKRAPHPATLFVLVQELAAAGIEFGELGVSFESYPPPEYVPTGIKQKR
ncbi:helix-turn-helix domain-containing protein [Devosia sp. CAU 1758]